MYDHFCKVSRLSGKPGTSDGMSVVWLPLTDRLSLWVERVDVHGEVESVLDGFH